MSNLVFPTLPGLAWDNPKRPMWKTKAQEAVSGREVRTALWSQPKYYFSLNFEFLRARVTMPELQQLMGFVNQVNGSFQSWLYLDPDDSFVKNEVIGIGNDVQRIFQLSRAYGGSSQAIWEPELSSMTFASTMWDYSNDPPMWSADGNTPMWGSDAGTFTYLGRGRVQFDTPPASGRKVVWSGRFYYRCRFAQDGYDFTQWSQRLWKLPRLDFVGSLSGKV